MRFFVNQSNQIPQKISASSIFKTDSHTLAFVGTDTNGGDNTIFLDNVRVIGTAPLQFSGVGFSTNGLSLTLQGPIGFNYLVLTSTNLLTWLPITNFVNTNSSLHFTDPQTNGYKQRFYRAMIQ
jgi:hypothetical protein